MNLLFLIASMDPNTGGPSQGIRNYIPELARLGIESEVVCLDDPNSNFLLSDNFITHALGPSKKPWNYNKKLLPWLLKNFYRFDAIIVQGLWLYHGYAARKALKMYKRSIKKNPPPLYYKEPKLFVMPHGMLDPYFQKAKDRRLKAIRNWIYWKLIENKLIKDAEGILFTCQTELHLAKMPFHPYKPKRELNIGFGIQEPPLYTEDMRDDFWEKCAAVKYHSYLLFLSRIHEKKGVDILITAYANILKKKIRRQILVLDDDSLVDEENWQKNNIPALVIAGPGLETAYGIRIQQMVNDLNLQSYVHFPGMLTGNTKWGAFYGCEAFILPSHQENFGVAIVEALACSKPVLITNYVNIWEEIETEDGGLIGEDTVESIQEMLEIWFELSSRRKYEMGLKAQVCYDKHFNITKVVKRFEKAVSV